jgi:hypothetical protein
MDKARKTLRGYAWLATHNEDNLKGDYKGIWKIYYLGVPTALSLGKREN